MIKELKMYLLSNTINKCCQTKIENNILENTSYKLIMESKTKIAKLENCNYQKIKKRGKNI